MKSKKELKEMIANISHDLRTPLTSIVGYIQMLKLRCSNDIKSIEYLNRVGIKAKDLETMLEDFFTLSVIDNSEYHLNLNYLDLNDILCDTLIGFYEQLEAGGIETKININPVGKIIGDRKSIIRIMENLMSNVLKYSTKEATINLTEKEDKFSLIVMNSLEDYKKIDTKRIFDKFYKNNDKIRTSKSTGLGLAIVKTLMEKMNGSVRTEQVGNRLYIKCQWDVA